MKARKHRPEPGVGDGLRCSKAPVAGFEAPRQTRSADLDPHPAPDLDRALQLGHSPEDFWFSLPESVLSRSPDRAVDHEELSAIKTGKPESNDLNSRPRLQLAGGGRVQRLTGFEIETHLPVYRDVKGPDPFLVQGAESGFTPKLGPFLFGGVKYGEIYGADPKGHFVFSADHNKLGRVHRKLLDLLVLAGLVKPDAPFRSAAILEYITPPREELAESADVLARLDFEITEKAIASAHKAATADGVTSVPDGFGVSTGVPKSALLDWAGKHVKTLGPIQMVLQELQELVSANLLYVQKTTGVLPEDVPALFRYAEEKSGSSEKRTAKVVQDVNRKSREVGEATFDELESFLKPADIPKAFREQKKAVRGYLSYLASHLFADSLSETRFVSEGSTDKNLFPYFPKVSLSQSFQALPQALRSEDARTIWIYLVGELIKQAKPYASKYWRSTYRLGENLEQESKIFGEDLNESLQMEIRALDSKEDPEEVAKNKAELERKQARTMFEKLVSGDPEVHIGVEKNLPGLDSPTDPLKEATSQMAIPMEDRFVELKYPAPINSESIGKVLTTEWQEAVDRGLSHLSGDVKDQTLESKMKELSVEAMRRHAAMARAVDLSRLEKRLSVFLKTFEENLTRLIDMIDRQKDEVSDVVVRAVERQKDIPELEKKIAGLEQRADNGKKDKLRLETLLEKNKTGLDGLYECNLQLDDEVDEKEIKKNEALIAESWKAHEANQKKINELEDKIIDIGYEIEDLKSELAEIQNAKAAQQKAGDLLEELKGSLIVMKQGKEVSEQQLERVQEALKILTVPGGDLEEAQKLFQDAQTSHLAGLHKNFDAKLTLDKNLDPVFKDFGIEKREKRGKRLLDKLEKHSPKPTELIQKIEKGLETQEKSSGIVRKQAGKNAEATIEAMVVAIDNGRVLDTLFEEASAILKSSD